MNKRLLSTALVASLALFGTGCATWNNDAPKRADYADADIVSENHKAADALVAGAPYLQTGAPILTGTFVNVNGMEQSSAFGRITAEQVGSRFAQKGYSVIEMKMRNNVYIQEGGGEFVLSREVRELAQTHNAHAVIAGTYAVGREGVYVSARLVRVADSRILSSYDYRLPMGPDTRALIASNN